MRSAIDCPCCNRSITLPLPDPARYNINPFTVPLDEPLLCSCSQAIYGSLLYRVIRGVANVVGGTLVWYTRANDRKVGVPCLQ